LTANEKEDKDFFRYAQSVKEFNYEKEPAKKRPKPYTSRYPRGSIVQRLFDPMAVAQRNDEGSMEFNLSQADVDGIPDATKEQFDLFDSHAECEEDEEDESAFYAHMAQELNAVNIDN